MLRNGRCIMVLMHMLIPVTVNTINHLNRLLAHTRRYVFDQVNVLNESRTLAANFDITNVKYCLFTLKRQNTYFNIKIKFDVN